MSSACDVKLYIYDVTRGLARQMSSFVLGKQINGIWHTGIVVYEKEFFFGSNGIGYCRPCGTVLGEPDEIHHLGATQLSEEEFQLFLIRVGEQQFRPECYHLFDHNCNTFSNEVSQFLTGQTIPKHVLEVPKEIFNTQLGAMIKPIYESMTAHPIGGNSSMTSAFTRSSDSHSIDQPRPAISNIDQPHSRNSEISENSKDSTSAVNVGLDNENMVDKKNDVEAIVKSLLEGDTGEIVKAVILVRDVSLSKVSNESAIEYSSAILECIQKNEHLPKETVYHSLMALRNFMKISPEVVNLTCLIGRDLSKFRELSPAMDKLCNELDEYINTTRD